MAHKIGDIVVPAPEVGWPKRIVGKRFVITSVPRGARGVNYKAQPCDAEGNAVAGGQGITGPEYALLPFTGEEVATVTAIEYIPNPPVGAVVRPTGRGIPAGYYVVIGETDHQRVRIITLGGDPTGRYWRAYSRSLEVIDPSRITVAEG